MNKAIPATVRMVAKLLARRVHKGLPPVLSFAVDALAKPGEGLDDMRARVQAELDAAGFLVAFGRHATIVSADTNFAPAIN